MAEVKAVHIYDTRDYDRYGKFQELQYVAQLLQRNGTENRGKSFFFIQFTEITTWL